MTGEYDYSTPQDIEKHLCRGYELELYEKQSLAEIERMIDLKLYSESGTIQKHMEFLEHLSLKLHHIRNEEAREGFATFELDLVINKISIIMKQLMNMLYTVDEDLHMSQVLPTNKFKYA